MDPKTPVPSATRLVVRQLAELLRTRLDNKLKERRAELGLTQAELAEMVGVTRKTVNTIENQVFVPSAILALKLARALKMPVEELFAISSD